MAGYEDPTRTALGAPERVDGYELKTSQGPKSAFHPINLGVKVSHSGAQKEEPKENIFTPNIRRSLARLGGSDRSS